MGHDALAMMLLGVQRIRVVSQTGNRNAGLLDEIAHAPGLLVAQACHVEVRYSRVSTVRSARRPAHQLDAAEAFVGCEREDLFERQVRHNRADETDLHASLPYLFVVYI